jgi:hypothetical protein
MDIKLLFSSNKKMKAIKTEPEDEISRTLFAILLFSLKRMFPFKSEVFIV